jgi:hypothetical protein
MLNYSYSYALFWMLFIVLCIDLYASASFEILQHRSVTALVTSATCKKIRRVVLWIVLAPFRGQYSAFSPFAGTEVGTPGVPA